MITSAGYAYGALWAAAENDGPTFVVYLAAIGGFLGTIFGGVTVWWTIRDRKRQLALDAERLEGEKSKVTRDEFEAINEGLGSLSDRWEKQARDAWAEIETLKQHDREKDELIDQLRLQVKVLQQELIEEKKRYLRCMERIDVLEGTQHE